MTDERATFRLRPALRRQTLCLALGLLGGALACGAGERAAVPLGTGSTGVESASGFEGGARSIEATGQGLELSLPDAAGWRHDPRQRATWVARHAATRSLLLARTWHADTIVRTEDCESQMRLWRPDLPALDDEARIESRKLSLAGGYAARLTSGARAARAPGGAVFGHALLFGSDGRSCVCLAFSTSAEGAGAARAVGERLAVMSRLVFERARRIGIEARLAVPPR
jgi:hypothetical protein